MDMQNRTYKLPDTLKRLMRKHPATKAKVTQKELALAIGVRPQTVAQYVTGETQPSSEKLLKMADYFGVSADYMLIGYEDGDLYFAMRDALCRRLSDRLGNIAVLCSQAENEALYIMAHEVKTDVQE